MDHQSRGGPGNNTNYRGGGNRGGNRGGGRGGRGNFGSSGPPREGGVSAQVAKETPDHSPIDGVEGLIARLGDTYLTLDDPTQVNLYNNYNHQFDIYLPQNEILDTFYNEPIPLHTQIRKIAEQIRPLLNPNLPPTTITMNQILPQTGPKAAKGKSDELVIDRVLKTTLKAIVAFPTKISAYAAFVAHLGVEFPNFITLVINEVYKQLEASIRGLFVVMLLDIRKKNMDINGVGKSRALLKLIQTLTLSSTPTTTITAPAIYYEALLRFISCLVGYGCIPIASWKAILQSLLIMVNISTHSPQGGDFDSILPTNFDSDYHNDNNNSGNNNNNNSGNNNTNNKNVHLSMYLPDALPFELSSIQSVIETVQKFNIVSTNESNLNSIVADNLMSDDKNTPNNDDDIAITPDQHQNSSSYRTTPVLTAGAHIQFTALNDIIVHGVLSALVFASRDVLNFGQVYNNTQHGDNNVPKLQELIQNSNSAQNAQNNSTILNFDSILFNLETNWYNNIDSRSFEDNDLELDYDFQSNPPFLSLPGVDTAMTELSSVIIDDVKFQVNSIELFFIQTFKDISTYLFFRNKAFFTHSAHSTALTNASPDTVALGQTTLFNTSTYITDDANTFDFFAHPNLYQNDHSSPFQPKDSKQHSSFLYQNSTQSKNSDYFDYLTWSYFAITGSLPDGTVHIIRPLQSPNRTHCWGLITRPFSIPTPSFRLFKSSIRQHYITTSSRPQIGKTTETYVFNPPSTISMKNLYIVPSLRSNFFDNENNHNKINNNVTKVARKKTGSTISFQQKELFDPNQKDQKMSKKLVDYLEPFQSSLLSKYTTTFPPSEQHPIIYFVTQPASFPPVLPLIQPRAQPQQHQQPQHPNNNPISADKLTNAPNPSQSKYTMVPNVNNIDVWLTYSYLFYSNITYYGLQEEYMSLLSSLPPLHPIWGYSQSPLYLTKDGSGYRKYAKMAATSSRQSSATQSSLSTVLSFLFAMIVHNQNNFLEPLTPPETDTVEQKAFVHTNITSSHKAHFIATLIRFMYEHPTKVPPFLGPLFFQLFKLVHFFSLNSRQNLSTWFAEHLAQFNFMFPWDRFAFLNSLNDPTHIQHIFMSHVLAKCVKLTSFSVVAANIQQLWLLLPSISYTLSTISPQTYQSRRNNNINNDNDHVSIGVSTFTDGNHLLNDGTTGLETKLILAPTITTLPVLNESFLILTKALRAHIHKTIILTMLYFNPDLHTIGHFAQVLQTLPTLNVAEQYAIKSEYLSYLTVSQAATYNIKPENVNLYCCYLWVSLLIASKATSTHFQYYLTNYGDILTILCNTRPRDALHDGFSGFSISSNDENTSTIPGQDQYPKDHETINPTKIDEDLIKNIITNSNFVYSPPFPPTMLYSNGFIVTPFVTREGVLASPSTTTITAIPSNPTQIVMLDLLSLFFHNDLSQLSTRLQLLLQFNIISIQTGIIWLLFYLPRHEHIKSTVFNPILMELLFMMIDLYLIAHNEKECKYVHMLKTTFAQIHSVPVKSNNNKNQMNENNNSENSENSENLQPNEQPQQQPQPQQDEETIIEDIITPAISSKITQIQHRVDSVAKFKTNLFSTIFSLIFDWVSDWPTLGHVLKTQSFARHEAFQRGTIDHDDNGGDDGDDEISAAKRQKVSDVDVMSNSALENYVNDLVMIYEYDLDIKKFVNSIIIMIVNKYKAHLRPIAQDLVSACNIPGLEDIVKQVYQ